MNTCKYQHVKSDVLLTSHSLGLLVNCQAYSKEFLKLVFFPLLLPLLFFFFCFLHCKKYIAFQSLPSFCFTSSHTIFHLPYHLSPVSPELQPSLYKLLNFLPSSSHFLLVQLSACWWLHQICAPCIECPKINAIKHHYFNEGHVQFLPHFNLDCIWLFYLVFVPGVILSARLLSSTLLGVFP